LLARAKLRLDLGLANRARALGQSLGRWSLRLSVAAAIVVALGGAVLTARAYWLKLAAMPKTGTAVFESVPPGSEVLVDGAAVGSTPLTTQLKPGRHVVEFRRRKATRTLEINVAAGQSVVGHLDWTAKRTGDLQVQSDPPGAKVLIDGKERGVTPLTVGDLAVGSHAVVLESASGTVRRTVDVTADATAEVNESIFSGWLHISSPIEVEISEGARQVHPDEKNLVLLGPGSHTLRFENKSLGYHDTRQVAIKAGQTVSILIDPPPSTLSVTATSAAEVLVDGERVGETPLTDHPIKLGTRDITVRSESSGERKFTITVGTQAARVDVDFAKP
jgi:hypothetical protein